MPCEGRIASSVLAGLLALGACSSCTTDDVVGQVDPDADPSDGACIHDTIDGPDSAEALAANGEILWAEGQLCPLGDHDWYSLTIPGDHALLEVSLSVHGPLSPVQPTYGVYSCDPSCLADPGDEGPGECCDVTAAPRAAEVAEDLDVTHCLQPGEYFVVVRDLGDDNQDSRDPRGLVQLSLVTRPDPDGEAEPNDGPESSTPPTSLAEGRWTAQGHIACRGDQDWYVVEADAGDLIDVTLEVGISTFQPQLRIVDEAGERIALLTNARGDQEPTSLGGQYQLTTAGRYYVVVEDNDGSESSAPDSDPYELTIERSAGERGEPNNDPETATVLGSLSCAASWASLDAVGWIGAENDVDMYRVDIQEGCNRGVLEVEVALAEGGGDSLEPSVRIVRPHGATACETYRDCGSLNQSCADGEAALGSLDCGGIGNVCLGDEVGQCAGASLCLSGGLCGANIIERHPDRCGVDGHCRGPSGAMRNRECVSHGDCGAQDRVRTAIPLGRLPEGPLRAPDHLLLVVQDFGADSFGTRSYSLTARARRDPDLTEPNERYSPFLTQESDITAADLGSSIEWESCVVGYLSYERDLDFFHLPHPCPDSVQGCTLKVEYDVGEGPVEVYATMGSGPYDNILETELDIDLAENEPRMGDIGGTETCLAANSYTPTELTVLVRDREPLRDSSAEQPYEICFSVESLVCADPCELGTEDQCWEP